MEEVEIFIQPDGTVKFIYYDELKPVLEEFNYSVTRASHVDPEKTKDGLKWVAKIVSGPKLGPFETRYEAIKAEIKWLKENELNKQDIL